MNEECGLPSEEARHRMDAAVQALEQRGYVPPAIMVQVSGRCNLRCIMCAHQQETTRPAWMDPNLFRRLLDEMVEVRIASLFFAGAWGEPFLHPEIFSFLEEASSRGFKVNVSTNMMSLTEEKIRRLLDMQLDTIQLSFSGTDAESYESVYVGGRFNHALFVLRNFKALRPEHSDGQPRLLVNGCILAADGAAAAERTFSLLRSMGYLESEIELKIPCNFAGQGAVSEKDGWSRRALVPSSLSLCPVIHDSWGVLVDGRVTACGCLDSAGRLTIGDLATQSLREIANGERIRELVGAFRRFDLGGLLCDRCDVPHGEERMIRLFPSQTSANQSL